MPVCNDDKPDLAVHAPSGKKTARVFFALWPAPVCREKLADWQRRLHPLCGGRAMRPDTLHATLVFLGEVEAERMEDLESAAQRVRAAPVEFVLDTAGYWAHNRIVYAAPNQEPMLLEALVQDLRQSLAKYGFSFDGQAYKPHVTLIRNASGHAGPLPGGRIFWRAREFVLVQSQLSERGASYRVLARFPLG